MAHRAPDAPRASKGAAARALALALALAATLACPGLSRAAESGHRLRVLLDRETFAENPPLDIAAALEAWIAEISRDLSSPLATRVEIVQGTSQLAKVVEEDRADMVVLNSLTYLKLRATLPLDPIILVSHSPTEGEVYRLLVHRASGLLDLRRLSGRSLLVTNAGRGAIPRRWLEVTLREASLPGPDEFFASVREVDKGTRSVLPVFFRQADACVVEDVVFKTMVELNPQVGRDLVTLATSPVLPSSIVCFRRGYDDQVGKDLFWKHIFVLQGHPRGRQFWTLYRLDHLTRFDPAQLTNLEGLLAVR